MRMWQVPAVGAAVVALAVVGCGQIGPSSGSNVPMATSGPNQVVFSVPGMT